MEGVIIRKSHAWVPSRSALVILADLKKQDTKAFTDVWPIANSWRANILGTMK